MVGEGGSSGSLESAPLNLVLSAQCCFHVGLFLGGVFPEVQMLSQENGL